MTTFIRQLKPLAAAVIALTVIAVAASDVFAGGSCCSSEKAGAGGTTTPDCHSGQQVVQRQSEPAFQSPHGGQLTKTLWNYFETVYGPQETRVYLYNTYRAPMSAGGIKGWVIMQVRSGGGEFRYPVHYVPVPGGQDYLAVRVDLTRVRDGDMDVYFDLANLPNRADPTVRFAQTYAMTRQPPPAVAPNYLAQPQIVVATATRADDAAIRAQGVCPVMKQPLGSHGTPTKIVIGGRAVFVCCEGCVDTVKQNPGVYLAQING